MLLRLFAIGLLLAAGTAWGQTKAVFSTTESRGGAPTAEQTRLNDLITNGTTGINALTTKYNTYRITADRAKRCGMMGMAYAPSSSSVVSGTGGCIVLPNQPLVREVKATTNTTTGNMGSATANAWTSINNFVNSNGCSNSEGWYACSDEQIRFAFAKGIPLPSDSQLWINTMERKIALRMVTSAVVTSDVTCGVSGGVIRHWSNGTSGFGAILQNYEGTTGYGITAVACTNALRVACCR